MSKTKRKTRSDRFPLTLHSTGQYCKKIKGKMHYFGKDKKQALERYLEQAAFLHNGKAEMLNTTNGNMTLKSLCNIYLQHQQAKAASAEITIRHYADQSSCLKKFMSFIGQHRKISEISSLDLQNYKRKLKRAYNSAHRINLSISIMKTMFHWARKNDVLDHIPNVDAVSSAKIIHKQRHVFTSEETRRLFDCADVQMKAMIWLGLNCGFGCTDCAELRWSDLDPANGRVKLARGKTGVSRDLPLWPETIQSLENIPKSAKSVFSTAKEKPLIRTTYQTNRDGSGKYSNINLVTSRFCKLMKKTGIQAPKGTGFYTLRRTAATIAARSGDPFAVQRLLGHADLKMATRYVQDVSKQTDKWQHDSSNS
ncbi:MAG: tyrosine-type recombinase/integrase [Planctomycetota bacterium]|jgi:integrase